MGWRGGLLNGAVVSFIGIQLFVTTLATLTIFRGLAFVLSGGRTISGADIPAAFAEFARSGPQIAESRRRAMILPNLPTAAACVHF